MFEHLLKPARIGKMTLRNHVIMAPTETHFCTTDGMLTQKDIDYYVRRARGGVGLILTTQIQGATKIDPIDPYPRSPRIDDNCYIPMLAELTEQVHEEGAKIVALISPGGGAQSMGVPYEAGYEGIKEVANVAPGTIPCPLNPRKIHQLTVEEIHQMTEVYARSCARAKKAGFDGVEIHAHGGYLLAEFLSPFYNNRDDEYGGNFENRTRIILEMIEAVKKYCGPDYPIFVRYAADEGIGDKGRQLPESIELAKLLEKAGVSALDIGAGTAMAGPLICPTVYHPKGIFTDYTKAIKEAVNIPVIVQGRLHDPEVAEQVLVEEKADFISIGRGLVCEPDWVKKVKENNLSDFRRCLSCNYCHGERIMHSHTIRCAFNPTVGKEWKYLDGIKKAEIQKNVAVIGAGPAGLEAAYTAALRGHHVMLFDKASGIGEGKQFQAACTPPAKENLLNIKNYYTNVLTKLENVELHFDTNVTEEMLKTLNADAVILATGGESFAPAIPGLKENKHMVHATDVLTGKAVTEGKVVIAGGGQVGAETAHFLKMKGVDTDIVEMMPMLAMDAEIMTKFTLILTLQGMGLKPYVSHRILEVNESSLKVMDLNTNEVKNIDFDTLIVALGNQPENKLETVISENFEEYYVVGDANASGNIAKAIQEGFVAAMKL